MWRQQLPTNRLGLQPAKAWKIQSQISLQIYTGDFTEFSIAAELDQIRLIGKAFGYKPKVGRSLGMFRQHQHTGLFPQPLLPKRLIVLAGKFYSRQINSRQGLILR